MDEGGALGAPPLCGCCHGVEPAPPGWQQLAALIPPPTRWQLWDPNPLLLLSSLAVKTFTWKQPADPGSAASRSAGQRLMTSPAHVPKWTVSVSPPSARLLLPSRVSEDRRLCVSVSPRPSRRSITMATTYRHANTNRQEMPETAGHGHGGDSVPLRYEETSVTQVYWDHTHTHGLLSLVRLGSCWDGARVAMVTDASVSTTEVLLVQTMVPDQTRTRLMRVVPGGQTGQETSVSSRGTSGEGASHLWVCVWSTCVPLILQCHHQVAMVMTLVNSRGVDTETSLVSPLACWFWTEKTEFRTEPTLQTATSPRRQ